MQVKRIAECSKGSILQYFRPSLSYHFVKIFVLSIFMWPFYIGFTIYPAVRELMTNLVLPIGKWVWHLTPFFLEQEH